MYFDNRIDSSIFRALLAQLDRVLGYEPRGRGFESLAARQIPEFFRISRRSVERNFKGL